MKTQRLGKTELQVSALGFGSGPVGYLGESAERTGEVVNFLLDQGVNLIDTAACYPNSERLLAQAVGHRRDDYVLVSKCGHRVEGIDAPEWSPELIGQSVDRSLRTLGTDHLDVLLLHTCSREVLERGEALPAIAKARDAGKVRFIGYSGDNEAAAYAVHLPEISVLETSVNICDQANIDSVLPSAAANDVGVLAKRPMANAAWKAAEQQRGIYRGYAEPYAKRLASMDLDRAELGIAEEGDGGFARLALRFTLSVPGVHSALTGTTNRDNAQQNVASAAQGPLDSATYQRLRQAFETARNADGSSWPGLG